MALNTANVVAYRQNALEACFLPDTRRAAASGLDMTERAPAGSSRFVCSLPPDSDRNPMDRYIVFPSNSRTRSSSPGFMW